MTNRRHSQRSANSRQVGVGLDEAVLIYHVCIQPDHASVRDQLRSIPNRDVAIGLQRQLTAVDAQVPGSARSQRDVAGAGGGLSGSLEHDLGEIGKRAIYVQIQRAAIQTIGPG